jgi:uncharacterized protein YegJ (DUF2314 family)
MQTNEATVRRFLILRVFAVCAVVAVYLTGTAWAEDTSAPIDKVILFNTGDPAMNAAVGKARDTLPVFWKMFVAPDDGVDGFSLKLGISDGKMTEHFWCSEIQGNQDKSTCIIANEPQDVHTVTIGQTVDVDPAIISDWMYRKNGKIVGGQTIRVMITTMAPGEAEQYKAMMAEE